MDTMTLGVIYAIKRGDTECPVQDEIVDFLHKYTLTPKEHYNISKITKIIEKSFADYLSTCRFPNHVVEEYFNEREKLKTFKELYPESYKAYYGNNPFSMDTNALINVLCNVQVREKIGEEYVYINDFRDLEVE